MKLPQFPVNPFRLQLSFHKVIERMEQMATSGNQFESPRAQSLLQRVAAQPELKDGITEIEQIEKNASLIADLLSDLFPAGLTTNEIKAVSIPFQGYLFNMTDRFKNILNGAGPSFDFTIRDFDDHKFYIYSCCLILNSFYGTRFDFAKPLFYDIPTATGVIRHYRILYNADFLEIMRTEKSIDLTPDDIALLMDNYNDLALWKAKLPPESYVLKGFALITLVDVTVENAVSDLKTNLLGNSAIPDFLQKFEVILRSIFSIPDIRMGFTSFDKETGQFNNHPFGKKLPSFLLPVKLEEECRKLLCNGSYHNIMEKHSYFSVSNLPEYIRANPGNEMGMHFSEQNVQSFILAPVVKDDVLLGILELVSPRKKEFNSVNANKLEVVMPLLIDSIERKIREMQNQIQAVIQNNYTTLHPSVDWKFKLEAQKYIQHINMGLLYTLKEISFKDVYPLYGQVDIKDSSITRNLSVKTDLENQLRQLIPLFEQLHQYQYIVTAEKNLLKLKSFVNDLSIGINADTEQQIQHYLETRIYPLLKANASNGVLSDKIEYYFKQTDAAKGEFYSSRRNYERTLSLVNEKLASILDSRQLEIQSCFPHYYERFKTDGVEHNLYIGASIAPKQNFTDADLSRLRLWQLRVIIEMEMELHILRDTLPYNLGVASLILVFSNPIDIRFRMDEKHFDIDGAYNIRYEVIKKRIDKAHIKGTTERITQQGKITIIYSQKEDEQQYRQYIYLLQKNGLLTDDIEQFDVEDLQGVSGLKALRIGILYESYASINSHNMYSDLYVQIQEENIVNS
ncbi:hypothetical protein [Mucilaginibacter paludis]|uniref:GAF domain-containing protein n=1 Tax=Mucilaginibacter paludis DSM 18603 TaxID=714943 RepID=H1YB84_9SPHI|nr:hypothetical protein [Mucilaginibacter paludis]EHQ30610.1 hypothetical protein Mucpa_6557 [Mucilaginibacter paludis DSM 18603]